MAWSRYQNAIFEYAANPAYGSFVVRAVAGSGKTTTAVECARRIAASAPGTRILFLAFNKSITEELTNRLAEYPDIRCSTLHALGLGVLGHIKVSINENKFRDFFIKKYSKFVDVALDDAKKWMFIRNCTEMLRLCRINMVSGKDAEGILSVMNRHSIVPVANETAVVGKVLSMASNLMLFKTSDGYEIDYTDMITLPLTEGFRKHIPRYDVVFIDEAQDLSRAQRELMLECVKPGEGRFIAVGDPAQSIVGFAGAMCDSFDSLAEIAGKVLPLSVNYRCGKTIIESAKKYVSEIEAYEDACEGEIIRTSGLKDVLPGDMVLCRKTRPLVTVAVKMVSAGKRCFIKGREIADSVIRLAEQAEACLGSEDVPYPGYLYSYLDSLIASLMERLTLQGEENPAFHPAVLELRDRTDACRTLAAVTVSMEQFKTAVAAIFSDERREDAVMLSTVHKAKGLEADNVFIICPELLPYRHMNQKAWEVEQENNLTYVAITRAKKRLVYVDVPENSIETISC